MQAANIRKSVSKENSEHRKFHGVIMPRDPMQILIQKVKKDQSISLK